MVTGPLSLSHPLSIFGQCQFLIKERLAVQKNGTHLLLPTTCSKSPLPDLADKKKQCPGGVGISRDAYAY